MTNSRIRRLSSLRPRTLSGYPLVEPTERLLRTERLRSIQLERDRQTYADRARDVEEKVRVAEANGTAAGARDMLDALISDALDDERAEAGIYTWLSKRREESFGDPVL